MADLAVRFSNAMRALAGRTDVGVFDGVKPDSASGKMLTGIFPGAVGSPPVRGTRETQDAYSQMPWLRAAVSKIASDVAAVDWHLYVTQRKNEPKAYRHTKAQWSSGDGGQSRRRMLKGLKQAGELREIDVHPMLDLLNSANPFLTGLAARRLTQSYLELVGEVFWLKERNGVGAPVAIWPIPPSWILSTPTPSRKLFRISYRGWQAEVPDTEILWMADPDPSNPYGRGTGVARALADELDTDEYIAKHLKQWFFNRARPDLIISGDGMGPDDTKRMEVDWLQKLQGVFRAFRPYFIGKKIDVHELDQDFRSMEVTKLRGSIRDVILQVWGLSPEILGIVESSNRATAEAAQFIYGTRVLAPRLEFMRANLQERLVPEYDARLILDYDLPIHEDKEHSRVVAMAAPWSRTVDEWRALQGLEPLDAGEGEVFMVSSGIKPVESLDPESDAFAPPPMLAPFAGNGNGGPPKAPNDEDAKKPEDAAKGFSHSMADLQGLTTKDALERLADRLEPRLRDAFLRAATFARGVIDLEELARAIERGDFGAMDQVIALDRFTAELNGAVPVLRLGFETAGAVAADQLTSAGLQIRFDIMNPHAAAWASNNAARFVRDITEESRSAVRAIVERAVTDGIPPMAAARQIRDVVGLTERQADAVATFRAQLVADELAEDVIERRVSRYADARIRQRAQTIARTEIIGAVSNGQQELWRQAQSQGLIDPTTTKRVWMTTPDDRLDLKVCEPMDGQEVRLDEPFKTGANATVLTPPAHPNCRCVVTLRFETPKAQADRVVKGLDTLAETVREGLREAVSALTPAPKAPVARTVERDAQGLVTAVIEEGRRHRVERSPDGTIHRLTPE